MLLRNASANSLSSRANLGRCLCLSSQLLRILQGAFQKEPGDRIDIYSGDVATQSQGFQRNGSPARKWVKHLGSTTAVGFPDFTTKPSKVSVILSAPMQDATNSVRLYLLNHPAVDAFSLNLFGDPAGHAGQDGPTAVVVSLGPAIEWR